MAKQPQKFCPASEKRCGWLEWPCTWAFPEKIKELEQQEAERRVPKTNFLIIIGGYFTSGEVYKLNLDTKQFTHVNTLPYDHENSCAVVYQDDIFCFGGGNASLSSNECYSVDTVRFACTELSNMPERRLFPAAVKLNDTIYVSGGWNREALKSCGVFFPLARFFKWKSAPDMFFERSGHQMVAFCDLLPNEDGYHGDDVVCMGGSTGTFRLKAAERFNPISETWTILPPMGCARSDFAAAVVGMEIFAIGGDDGRILNSVEKFSSGQWSFVAPMMHARASHAAAVVKDKIYVVGGIGQTGQDEKSIEVYDPMTDQWSIFVETQKEFHSHSVVPITVRGRIV